MSNDFATALQANREKPRLTAVVLVTLPDDAKDPTELRILKIVGYCETQQAAMDYCTAKNAVFKPAKGGVNPYQTRALKKLD